MLKKKYGIMLCAALATLISLACGALSGPGGLQATQAPLPTYTPYPTYTPAVPPTPEGPQVLYENDFSDPENTLEIVDLERFSTSMKDGAYAVEHLSGGPAYIAIPVTAYNFVFDVDVSALQGPEDGATYGIGFRGREGYGGDYYRWRISTNGNFHLHASTDDKILPLEWFERGYDVAGDWFKSAAINQGYGATNHLRVVADEDELTFFINDQIVMHARDSRLQNTYFALITHADGYSETTFDDLRIAELDDSIIEEAQFPDVSLAAEPDFEAEFSSIHPCGDWLNYAEFHLVNTGSAAFESMSLLITEVETEDKVYSGSNNTAFVEQGGCPPGARDLPPGGNAYIAANLQYPEPGTEMKAAIRLCTEDDLNGECISQTVTFVFQPE